jgi:hypothetical protein
MTLGNGDNRYDPQEGDANLPVPDPTRLTTQLVDRALAGFREVVFNRLAAMDTATGLVAEGLRDMRHDSAVQHEHLKEDRDRQLASGREFILSRIEQVDKVGAEKFAAIATQFTERDTRTEQAAQESRISLDAALAAAKEAVSEQNKANTLAIGKSEDATKERLDALTLLMTNSFAALDDKINDLKGRMDRGEGQGQGVQATRTEQREATTDYRAWIVALIAAVIGVAGLIVALFR